MTRKKEYELADKLRREARLQQHELVAPRHIPELLIEAAAALEHLAMLIEEVSYE